MPKVKLTLDDILRIRQLLETKGEINYARIGRKFGISASSVSKIHKGESWKKVA